MSKNRKRSNAVTTGGNRDMMAARQDRLKSGSYGSHDSRPRRERTRAASFAAHMKTYA